jgi:hypothetical protein
MPACVPLLFAALVGAPADPGAEAEAQKAEGFRQFAAGHYEAGIAAMERAYAAVRHPDFLLNIAVAHDKRGGHCQDALLALQRYFVDCGDCSNRALAERKATEIEERCEIELTLDSEPSGAWLRVDQMVVLKTPARVRLARGRHRVLASHPAIAVPLETAIAVTAPLRRLVLTLSNPSEPPRLKLRGAPEDVALVLDGVPVRAASSGIEVAAGAHTLSVERAGEAPRVLEGTVSSGQVLELDVWSPADRLMIVDAEGRSAPTLLEARPPPAGAVSGEPLAAATAPQPNAMRPWAWASTGTGIASLIAGGVFTALALGDLDRTHRLENASVRDPAQINDAQVSYARDFSVAEAAFALAVVGVGTGLLLFAFGDR